MKHEELIEMLEAVAFKVGGTVRRGYSGRFMHGAQCYGIDCDDYIGCIEWAAEYGLEGARWDHMGRQYIVYWPSIPYDTDKDHALQHTGEDTRPRRLTRDDVAQLPPEKRIALDLALSRSTEGVSALIELLDVLGTQERNSVRKLVLALEELEHLKSGGQ